MTFDPHIELSLTFLLVGWWEGRGEGELSVFPDYGGNHHT